MDVAECLNTWTVDNQDSPALQSWYSLVCLVLPNQLRQVWVKLNVGEKGCWKISVSYTLFQQTVEWTDGQKTEQLAQ